MSKRIFAVVAALCMLLSVGTASLAAPGVAPFWANVNLVTAYVSFSGGNATASSSVATKPGTTSISVTCTLQRKVGSGYTSVGSWTASSTGQTLLTSHSYSATSGQLYRLKVSVIAVTNGISEAVEFTSADYTCP